MAPCGRARVLEGNPGDTGCSPGVGGYPTFWRCWYHGNHQGQQHLWCAASLIPGEKLLRATNGRAREGKPFRDQRTMSGPRLCPILPLEKEII